ncbi:MAG: DUF3971 domain-containing protein [Rhodospirillaceae bacterium]
MINRVAVFLAQGLAILMIAVAVLTGLAVWRVASGPVSVELLTPYLARALDDAVGGAGTLRTEVVDTVLIWGGFDHPLELRLRGVRLSSGTDNHVVAQVPEMAVGLSLRSLARGRLALARLAVIGPMLHLERTVDGRLTLDLDGPGGGSHPALVVAAEAAAEGAAGPLSGLLAALRQPAGHDGALAVLTQVSIVNASVTLEDRAAGVMWSVPAASLIAKRGDDGIRAQARIEMPAPGHPGVVELTASERVSDGAILASLKLRDVDAGALASALPALAPFAGSRVPLSGSLEAIFDGDFRPLRLRLALADAGPGVLTAPGLLEAPLRLGTLALAAVVEPGAGRFSLEKARLTLTEPALTLTAAGQGGASGGALRLTLASGPHTARIDADLVPAAAGTELVLKIADLEPALLAGLSRALAPVAVPVSGTVRLALGSGWTPDRLAVDLALKPGRLQLPPALLAEPVPVRGGTLRLTVDQPFAAVPERIQLQKVAVDLGGPVLSLEGAITREGQRLAIRGGVRVRGVPAESLPRLWPHTVGRNARDWITRNITAGVIDEAWVGIDGSAPLADPSDIVAASLDGGVAASNLTVNYFKTLPPITGISGRGTSDGRDLVLTTSGGHILDLPLGEARIVFSKLDTPQEWIDIDAPLSGSIRSVLQVLDTAPLDYARRVGIDPARTQGSQTARLHFHFPLKKGIDIENVEIRTSASLHGAATEDVAGGLSVSSGELKLDIDNAGMDVTGTARIEGVPTTLQWREAFAEEADPQTRLTIRGEIGEAAAAARLPSLKGRLGGAVAADVLLLVDKRKKTTLSGRLDLGHARLAVPELNWIKPAGESGSAQISVVFDKGKPLRPFQLGLDTAGLRLAGSGSFDAAAGALARLTLSEVRGGANDFKLDLKTRPDRGHEIALSGASLDARPLLAPATDDAERKKARAARAAAPDKPREPGPRYDLSLQLARVVTGDQGRALTGVKGRVRHDGTGWDSLELDARVAGAPAGLAVRYLPEGAGRRLSVTSEDAGAVLRALDLTDSVLGGRLSLSGSGQPGIPAHPLSAKLEVGEFRVVGAPLLARLLNALSVTGLMELLNGEGLTFAQLAGDLTWSEDRLTLAEVRTSGGALGLTVDGPVDLAADTLALEGTIVPVYGLNRILGVIPILGDLLSGGKGQGIFAATYRLSGPAAQPEVSVNPLAVLAPGFLRNLFFLN